MSLEKALESLKKRDFADALAHMQGLDAAAFDTPHFLARGLAEMGLKDWLAALETFKAATARFPDHALFWLNRGIAEENAHLPDAAIASQEKCVALNPGQGEAWGNLSNLYRRKGDFARAEAAARRALQAGANKGDALNCLGLALLKQNRGGEAREILAAAHEAAPGNGDIILNRANLEVDGGNFPAAWNFFAAARAVEDKPIYRHDEALARLLAGAYETGWKLFEARLELPGALRARPACPRWQGEDVRGKKLLILAEQGFGDVIQFCRYQKNVPADAELVWAMPKNLLRLMAANLRGVVVDEKAPLPVCDFYAPILSLPLLTGHLRPESVGTYLKAPQTPVLPTGKRRRKIGLVWAGSKTHLRDRERSVPLRTLEALVNELPADFYAPFTGDALNEIGDLPVTRLDHLITDFADTAALLAQMDAVITVDTAVAHLAGALGIKTVILLPYCPDWRWGLSGDRTGWYPHTTLARQERPGDWERVIENLLEGGF